MDGFDIARYNKLISTIVGAAVGYVLAWLATKTPMATCVDVPAASAAAASKVCSFLGIPQAELTGLLIALCSGIGNLVSKRNSLTPVEVGEVVTKMSTPQKEEATREAIATLPPADKARVVVTTAETLPEVKTITVTSNAIGKMLNDVTGSKVTVAG